MYKLINNQLISAPNPLINGRLAVCNPTKQMLEECGYMELIESEMPIISDNQYLETQYQIVNNTIVKSYIVKDIEPQDQPLTELDIIEQLTDMDARLCQLEINTAEVITNDI